MDIYNMQVGKYLSENWSDLPNNVYMDKTNTGCGATTLAIENNQPYIILAPSVALVLNKADQHPHILPFYGDVTIATLLLYLHQGGRKIMATYDSLPRVVDALRSFNTIDWKLMIDEAHQLLNLAELKPSVLEYILDNYGKFSKWVFTTATPTKEEHLPDQLTGVTIVKLNWVNAETISLMCQSSKNISADVVALCHQHLKGSREGNPHVFLNHLSSICSIVKRLKRSGWGVGDIAICCADSFTNRQMLRQELGDEWMMPSRLNTGKRVHLYTSVAFEGADIYDEDGVSYVAIDCRKSNTKLDMCITIPQIAGRIRNSKYIGSLKMLVCGMPFGADLSYEQYCSQVDALMQDAIITCEQATHPTVKAALMKGLANDPYYIVEGGDIRPNKLMSKLAKQRYESLHSTYTTHRLGETKEVVLSDKITTQSDVFLFLDWQDNVVSEQNISWPALCKRYMQAVKAGDIETQEFVQSHEPSIKSIYNTIGVGRMTALRYGKQRMLQEMRLLSPDLTVLTGWKVGDFIKSEDIRDALSDYYDRMSIVKAVKVVDIGEWYLLGTTRRSGVKGFIVKGVRR
jgi:hypothetical protein